MLWLKVEAHGLIHVPNADFTRVLNVLDKAFRALESTIIFLLGIANSAGRLMAHSVRMDMTSQGVDVDKADLHFAIHLNNPSKKSI